MAKKIRSEYIKSLMEDKEKLDEQLNKVTNDTFKNILSETVNDSVKQLLKEDEDSFEEEEVDDSTKTDDVTDTTPETDEVATAETDGADVTDVTADDAEGTTEETSTEESGADETDTDEWGDLEQYKGEDGEYDLTGMDKESLIKVLKVMGPEDGVRVVKNDNGTVTLTDDETDKEYIIDVDGAMGGDEGSKESGEEETFNFEFETDDEDTIGEGKVNLGYTDNYQSETAMTTPDNHEPAKSSETYSMDGGVPTGTEKPFAKEGDKAPFDKTVSEGCEGGEACETEQPVNETMTTQEQGAYNRGTGMVHTNTNDKAAKGRNAHAGGKQIHGTADNSYSEAQMEAIKRKANEIFYENRELKKLLPVIQQRLNEAIVINQSLSNVVKLINENSTTKDEKSSIIERFNQVKTREESNALYETISRELKSANRRTQNVNDVINSQLSESKDNTLNEEKKPLYGSSEDLKKTKNLMQRLLKL